MCTYLLKRGSVYYFRRIVLDDLVGQFGEDLKTVADVGSFIASHVSLTTVRLACLFHANHVRKAIVVS